jgi:site-specific DNA-methyltransferase (adenine-specific)
MNPTWETADGSVRLYLGDCREVLDSVEADAYVVDPPYGINYESWRDGCLPRGIQGDDSTRIRDSIIERALPTACFATWRCVPPVRPRGCLIWEKAAGGMGDLSFPWQPNFEAIWIYGQGWNGFRGSSVLRASTVCTWNTGPARRFHPHEKPVDLLEQLIEKAPGETICDPCMGSGSTGCAAVRQGRKFIGVECDPNHFATAVSRIEAELNRCPLFDPAPVVKRQQEAF